jgi:hypothetical protein
MQHLGIGCAVLVAYRAGLELYQPGAFACDTRIFACHGRRLATVPGLEWRRIASL